MVRQCVLGLLVCVSFVQAAEAQLFSRFFNVRGRGNVSSSCPGGVCPTGAVQNHSATNQLFAAPFKVANNAQGHWSYPGDITSHLEGTHGVSTQNMSRQEKLNLHDALHEGDSVARYPAQSSVNIRTGYGSAGTSVSAGYGSTGSAIRTGYGSTGSFAVGQVYKGEVIASIAPVFAPRATDVQLSLAEVGFTELAVEPGFKGSLRKAISEARKADKIDVRTAFKLQSMTFSPAFVQAAQNLAVTQIVLSGENAEQVPRTDTGAVNTAGINWDGLGKFLQLFLPILLDFLKGLGL